MISISCTQIAFRTSCYDPRSSQSCLQPPSKMRRPNHRIINKHKSLQVRKNRIHLHPPLPQRMKKRKSDMSKKRGKKNDLWGWCRTWRKSKKHRPMVGLRTLKSRLRNRKSWRWRLVKRSLRSRFSRARPFTSDLQRGESASLWRTQWTDLYAAICQVTDSHWWAQRMLGFKRPSRIVTHLESIRTDQWPCEDAVPGVSLAILWSP